MSEMERDTRDRVIAVEQQVRHLDDKVDEKFKGLDEKWDEKFGELKVKLDEMHNVFTQAKGVRWFVIGCATFIGAILATLGWLLPWWFGNRP